MTYLRLQLGAQNSQANQVNSVLLFIYCCCSFSLYICSISLGGSLSIQYYYCFHSFVMKEMDRYKYWFEFLIKKYKRRRRRKELPWQSYSIQSKQYA